MRRIDVKKPTGYIGQNDVLIFDKNGKKFYEFRTNGQFKFNLPVGTFFTNSEFKEVPNPHTYEFKRTRRRENYNYKEPQKVKVVFATNPNKASIFLKKGLIVIDPKFLQFPSYVVDYLISHEIGHYYYTTEEFCDEFAQERMLKAGYNKSQIADCSSSTLGIGHGRVHSCVENLKKAKMK